MPTTTPGNPTPFVTSNEDLADRLAQQTALSARQAALPPALPSASSALALARGEPGALPVVVAHTALRAGIIGVGLYVSGQRQNLVRTAFVSSLAIEAFVLGWAMWKNSQAPVG
jgi:hypothetical protein